MYKFELVDHEDHTKIITAKRYEFSPNTMWVEFFDDNNNRVASANTNMVKSIQLIEDEG